MNKYWDFILSVIFAAIVIYAVAAWTGLDSFVFAWVLNFMLMMCLMAYTKTIQPKLTSSYYNLKEWEKGGKIYTYFGVNLFRKILVWSGWEKLNKKDSPVEKSLETLKRMEYATKKSEFGHLVIFFNVMIFTLYVMIKFGITNALWLLILNVLLNLYPIMVQRYNRPRIKRLLLKRY